MIGRVSKIFALPFNLQSKGVRTITTKNQKNKSIKKKKKDQTKERFRDRKNFKITIVLIILFGILSVFSTYAWFSSSLNVQVRTFNVVVDKTSGLTISLDGINFDSSVEINVNTLIRDLRTLYPNHTNQWSTNGLTPVSSNGITNPNSPVFNMFQSSGVLYYRRDQNRENGFVSTEQITETGPKEFSYYIAFDLFFKNVTGSPVSDNLYLDYGSSIIMNTDASEEMQGLGNSVRLGIVKIGSVDNDAPASVVQNVGCNGQCESIIYEPNSRNHTNLSIERASKYGVDLINGQRFPTYAFKMAGGPIFVKNTVSGSENLDLNYFSLQNTITEENLEEPLFQIPDGITKTRVYLWIEGQDIDSLETESDGAELTVSINFTKDTMGYNAFDE